MAVSYSWYDSKVNLNPYIVLPEKEKKPTEAEIAPNTYEGYMDYSTTLDMGIYTHHSRGEILNLKGFATLEKLERNSSVYSSLHNFILSVVEPKICVKAKNDSYNAGLLKEFIELNLSEMNGTIEETCEDILSAVLPGYSITEKVYKDIIWENQQKKVIKAFKNKKAGLYGFLVDPYDNVLSVRDLINYRDLPPEKFITFQFLRNHGNPYGFGLFDVLYPLYYAINELQKFMLLASAKFASPSVVLSVPSYTSDAVKEAVRAYAKNITQNSVGILPDSVKAAILDTANKSQNPYLDLLRYFISEVEKVILLNDLTVSQSNKYGTRSESAVKVEQGKLPLVRHTRRNLLGVLQEQFVRPNLKYNFDPSDFPINIFPELYFDDGNQTDRNGFVDTVETLTKEGYMSPEKDKQWVMKQSFENAPEKEIKYVPPKDSRSDKQKIADSLDSTDVIKGV